LKNHKTVKSIAALALLLFLAFCSAGFAHPGKTDAGGGHQDSKDKSGLGGYHYHHGYGAHLHEGGACPFLKDDAKAQAGSTDKIGALSDKNTKTEGKVTKE
jgi:hypothetical protein